MAVDYRIKNKITSLQFWERQTPPILLLGIF